MQRHDQRRHARATTVIALAAALVLTTAGGVLAADRFSDVGSGHRFHDDIGWMADTGISDGYADGTFRPGSAVTRQAMAAFMRRIAGADPDVDPMVTADHAETATSAATAGRADTADELGGHVPADFATAGHDHRVAATSLDIYTLETSYESRGSVVLDLPDACGDGSTTWAFRATVSGNLLTDVNPDATATVALSVDDATSPASGDSLNQTLQGNDQVREAYSLDRLFTDVPHGARTVHALAKFAGTANFVQVGGQLVVSTAGYTCSS